jgi:outer membrane lipoprotein SlyB
MGFGFKDNFDPHRSLEMSQKAMNGSISGLRGINIQKDEPGKPPKSFGGAVGGMAGGAGLGAMIGTGVSTGASAGPWGAAAGAVVGLAAYLFS